MFFHLTLIWLSFLLSPQLLTSTQDTSTTLRGTGTFTYSMLAYTSYSNSELSGAITSFPVEISLRDRVYFKVTLNAPAALGLTLSIVDIVATTAADMSASGALEYKIFENGCAVDSTYQAVSGGGGSGMSQTFSVEIFEFSSDSDADVFIHVGVIVCEENATDCGASCEDRKKRKKRSEKSFFTYNGPFVFVRKDHQKTLDEIKDKNDKSETEDSAANGVGSGMRGRIFVCLSIAWGFSCVIFYWLIKR